VNFGRSVVAVRFIIDCAVSDCGTILAVVKRAQIVVRFLEMKKRLLSDAFKAQLENQEEIAKQFGIPSSSLRNWLKRNKYPERFLPSLAKFAGLPTNLNQLAQEFEFRLTRPIRRRATGSPLSPEDHLGLLGIYRRFELQAQSFEKMQRKFGMEVREFFSAMRTGDVFFYFSLNVEPFEWEEGWQAVGALVQEAVERGAYFVYCLPDRNARKWAQGLGLRSTVEDWEAHWITFHENIKKGLKPEVQPKVEERVLKLECKPNSFMPPPDHKYTLFICKTTGERKSFVLLPTDTVNPGHLPLHNRFTATLYKDIKRTLEANNQISQETKDAITEPSYSAC
jgi:hypothetical protein